MEQKEILNLYFAEFIWRKKHKCDDLFDKIIGDILKIYSLDK